MKGNVDFLLFFTLAAICFYALNVELMWTGEKYCKGEIWKVNWYAPIDAYFTFFSISEWNQSKHVADIFFCLSFFFLAMNS